MTLALTTDTSDHMIAFQASFASPNAQHVSKQTLAINYKCTFEYKPRSSTKERYMVCGLAVHAQSILQNVRQVVTEFFHF